MSADKRSVAKDSRDSAVVEDMPKFLSKAFLDDARAGPALSRSCRRSPPSWTSCRSR
jgi:hypothetical protein